MSSRKSLSVREVPQAAGPLASFLQDVKKALGLLSEKAVLTDELVGTGLVRRSSSGGIEAPPSAESERIVPPQPSSVVWDAAITNVLVTFGGTNYHGHLYAEILRHPTNDYGSAEVVARGYNGVAVDAIGPNREAYYWLRYVSKSGVAGPPDTQAGTLLRTGQNVTALLDALTLAAEDPAAPYSKYAIRAGMFYVADDDTETDEPIFSVVTTPFTMNGVVVPVGVYFRDGFVMNGTIVNAKIANLAVDDAKIANVSVAKLVAGSISVGEYIQSTGYIPGSAGWRINGDGTAEFSNVVVRGTVFAAAGEIGGSTIGSNYIRSTTYVLGTSGWNFNSDGTGQIGAFQIGSNYIQSNNYVAGVSGWRLAADGSGQLRLATLDAISANLGTVTAGVLRNSTDSVNMNLNATGSSLVLRAGALTNYGPYVGNRYPVEIYANGSAFFGRDVVAGGSLKASGSYVIPGIERPAVVFESTPSTDMGGP